MLDFAYLEKLAGYLKSGDFAFDFEHAPEERRLTMLDFLEQLMDLAEVADEVATQAIFKNSSLGVLIGTSDQNQRSPEGPAPEEDPEEDKE